MPENIWVNTCTEAPRLVKLRVERLRTLRASSDTGNASSGIITIMTIVSLNSAYAATPRYHTAIMPFCKKSRNQMITAINVSWMSELIRDSKSPSLRWP